MKKVLFAVLLCAMVLSGGVAFGAPEYTIKVGYIGSENHPTMKALKEIFVPKVEEGSKGKIKVELYPNGQLGGDRELCESVLLNTVQIAIPASSVLGGFERQIQVLDLPYLFSGRDAAFEAVEGPLGERLNESLKKKGFFVLGYQENGIRHTSNSKRPIKTMKDLDGMKIRTMENSVHLASFKAFGANPTPMGWGELYTALQQGTVDGEENGYVLMVDGKFYEVQKYVSETGHFFSFEMLISSKKFMDSLPKDLQSLVLEAIKETTVYQRKLMAEEEAKAKAIMIEKGVEVNTLTPEARAEFVKASGKVYDKFEKKLGKDIMDIARSVQK